MFLPIEVSIPSTRSRYVEEVHRLRAAAGLPQDDRCGLGEAGVLLLGRWDASWDEPGDESSSELTELLWHYGLSMVY